ncbi:MAG: hypothetical protein P1U82_30205 [Verrucomicrobiales bacterium]|nr:hypothetical protein [Verrucomicrobiales bacterium]
MESTLRLTLERLPRSEKLRVIAFLAESLAKSEREYEICTPLDCEDAALLLQKFLLQENS